MEEKQQIIWKFQNYFLPLHRSVLVVPEAIQTIRCFFAHFQTSQVHFLGS